MSYALKVKYGDDLRRLTLSSPQISLLNSTVVSLFGLSSPSAPSSSPSLLKLRYMDDDGDWITISSDQELQEAFLTVKGLPLRIDVITSASAPSVLREEEVKEEVKEEVEEEEIKEEEVKEEEVKEEEVKEEEQPQQEENSTILNTTDIEGKAAEDFIPPPPQVEDAEEKKQEQEQSQAEAEERKREEEPPAELFDYVANEFHYHRIIIQTAVEAAFDSLRSQYASYEPKANEYLNKADTQRILIIQAIERTLEEWKRDVNSYPPAQEISQRVSESLREVGTFAAPVLDNIRASLTAALESLFKKKNPHAITSSDVLRELDTFTPSSEDIPEQPQEEQPQEQQPQQPQEQPQEQPELPMSEETSRITEEIESVLSQVAVEQPQATSDIHVGSDLAGDFVYVQEDDDFIYKQQLEEMLLMGFSNSEAIRTALINFEGNVEAALDSLL